MDANEVTEFSIPTLLTLAEAAPRRLAAASAGIADSRLREPPAPQAWSAMEILNHLRASEEVWMHSLHAMLAHDKPRLQEIHSRQWTKTINPFTKLSFASALQVFTLRREALLITLRALSPEDWAREGRVARKTHTVYSYVRRMVQHEQEHCKEIEKILG